MSKNNTFMYKLIKNGYPFLVTGTTDRGKHFRPIAHAICSDETSNAFSFIFKSIKECCSEFYNYNYNPTYLVADAADAITKACHEVFGESIKGVMFWFHRGQRVGDKLRHFEEYDQPKIDINIMQTSDSKKLFKKSFELFKKKWLKLNKYHINDFLSYFEEQLINKLSGWYEGFAPVPTMH